MKVTRYFALVALLPLLGGIANAQQPLARWRFDESSGGIAIDFSGAASSESVYAAQGSSSASLNPGNFIGKTIEICEKNLGKPGLVENPKFSPKAIFRYYKSPNKEVTRLVLERLPYGSMNGIVPKEVLAIRYHFPKGKKTYQEAMQTIGLPLGEITDTPRKNESLLINNFNVEWEPADKDTNHTNDDELRISLPYEATKKMLELQERKKKVSSDIPGKNQKRTESKSDSVLLNLDLLLGRDLVFYEKVLGMPRLVKPGTRVLIGGDVSTRYYSHPNFIDIILEHDSSQANIDGALRKLGPDVHTIEFRIPNGKFKTGEEALVSLGIRKVIVDRRSPSLVSFKSFRDAGKFSVGVRTEMGFAWSATWEPNDEKKKCAVLKIMAVAGDKFVPINDGNTNEDFSLAISLLMPTKEQLFSG